MEALIGKTVLDKAGNEVPTRSIIGPGTLIGLLFVWSVSIPCQEQVPKVIEFYDRKNRKFSRQFQIIVIDQESTEAKWKAYCNTMPWLAVPYKNVADVSSKFPNVIGFPTLQLYDGTSEKLLVPDIMQNILRGGKVPYLPMYNTDDIK